MPEHKALIDAATSAANLYLFSADDWRDADGDAGHGHTHRADARATELGGRAHAGGLTHAVALVDGDADGGEELDLSAQSMTAAIVEIAKQQLSPNNRNHK